MDTTRLKECRIRKGVSQKDVADFLGIDRTTYVKYELGSSNPNVSRLQKLAEYFNVTPDYLLGTSDTNLTDEAIRQIQIKAIANMGSTTDRTELEQKVVDLYNSMPPEMQKAALAQLEALAALNKK